MRSRLYLVDLAGCERVLKSGATGSVLKEAQHINKSLSALGDVMEALDTRSKYVPYRNSKLTYLLQDALGGNSRTMMIVTLAPGEDNAEESLHCLQFASRVRNIAPPGGRALRNVDAKNLEETLKKARNDLRIERHKRIKEEERANLLQQSLQTAEDNSEPPLNIALGVSVRRKRMLRANCRRLVQV